VRWGSRGRATVGSQWVNKERYDKNERGKVAWKGRGRRGRKPKKNRSVEVGDMLVKMKETRKG